MAKDNKEFRIEVPGGENVVVLHTCCAPCSSAIIECMMNSGITPVIYYCNPNIYPREEYEIRKNECTRYAQALGLEIVDADYDHEAFVVNGTATKQPNQSGAAGVEVTLPEYKMETPAAKTFYTIKFDVTNAGGASLEITLNDTLKDSIALEDVELNDNAK